MSGASEQRLEDSGANRAAFGRCALALSVFLSVLGGQEALAPPALQNAGQPMKVPFQCTEDDIHSAGLSCTEEEPCPAYLELSAFESVGSQYFAIGNIHSSAITLYSLLLASSDGGKTWREPFERIRGASIDQIRFVDFENGWISGQLVHPLPHDPFLLVSTDGGKSWRRRPLFDETRAGTILQLWFDSRDNGSLVLDRGQSSEGLRYELYESATGGESWMVREAADRPMRIKRMPATPVNTDWRVRPHAASKSFRIERRQAEQWTAVASFLVQLDPCKPPPRVVEPPPEPETPAPETVRPQPGSSRPAAPSKPPTLKRPRR